LAFTAEVSGAAGKAAAGLVIAAGLEPGAVETFAGALLSVDLQPVHTSISPKMIA
jgi:hypothetical protein